MIGVRERLQHAVIGYGDRLMPPFIGSFYNVFHFRHTVHIAHFRMAVQFHPLMHARIHARYREIRYLFHPVNRTYRQLMVKFIYDRRTLDLHKSPRLKLCRQLFILLVRYKNLDCHRIGKVRNIIDQNHSLILDLTFIHIQNPAAHDDIPDLSYDFLHRHRLFVKIPAE